MFSKHTELYSMYFILLIYRCTDTTLSQNPLKPPGGQEMLRGNNIPLDQQAAKTP